MKITIVKKGGAGSGNFGHAGRPGKIGGSASGAGGGGKSQGAFGEAPKSDAFLKNGNPGRGGDTPLPKGWKRVAVDRAEKKLVSGTASVSYHNGYYASLYMEDAGGKTLAGGKLVKWEDLQGEMDRLMPKKQKEYGDSLLGY